MHSLVRHTSCYFLRESRLVVRHRTVTRTFDGPGWGVSGGPVGSGPTITVCVT